MSKIRKFIWSETLPPIHYREGTSDEWIIKEIIVDKGAYIFPEILKVKTIFDIGANIGVATVLMSSIYPDAKIHCFEPQCENFDMLKRNTEHLKNVTINNFGLGEEASLAPLYKSSDKCNLGGYSIFPSKENPFPTDTIGFREAITLEKMSEYCQVNGVYPELIKIDCEGSEYPILKDCDLEKVKWITGELHSPNPWKLLDLLSETHHIRTQKDFLEKNWCFHAGHKSLSLFVTD